MFLIKRLFKIRFFLFCGFLLVLPVLFYSTNSLSLENALQTALANSPDIQLSEKDLSIAKAQMGQAEADLYMPQVSVSAGYNLTGSPETVVTNSVGKNAYFLTTNGGNSDTVSAGLSVSKTIVAGFSGLETWNALSSKQSAFKLASARLEDTKTQIKYNVTTKYYHLLLVFDSLKSAESALSNQTLQFGFAQENYKKGTTTELALLQSKAAYRSAVSKYNKAVHNAESEKVSFLNYIGLTNDYQVQPDGNFDSITNVEEVTLPETDIINRALDNDISYLTLEYSADSAKIAYSELSLSRFPSITGNFNFNYDYKDSSTSTAEKTWQQSWSAGVQASWSIDGLLPFSKTGQSVDESGYNLDKQNISLAQKESDIRLQTSTLIGQIADYKDALESQKDSIDIAYKTFDLSKKQAALGSAGSLDLQSAETAYLQSITDYHSALYDYYSSLINLRRIAGLTF